jgi:hypothetical protein
MGEATRTVTLGAVEAAEKEVAEAAAVAEEARRNALTYRAS